MGTTRPARSIVSESIGQLLTSTERCELYHVKSQKSKVEYKSWIVHVNSTCRMPDIKHFPTSSTSRLPSTWTIQTTNQIHLAHCNSKHGMCTKQVRIPHSGLVGSKFHAAIGTMMRQTLGVQRRIRYRLGDKSSVTHETHSPVDFRTQSNICSQAHESQCSSPSHRFHKLRWPECDLHCDQNPVLYYGQSPVYNEWHVHE